jgi:hypothetical protein
VVRRRLAGALGSALVLLVLTGTPAAVARTVPIGIGEQQQGTDAGRAPDRAGRPALWLLYDNNAGQTRAALMSFLPRHSSPSMLQFQRPDQT